MDSKPPSNTTLLHRAFTMMFGNFNPIVGWIATVRLVGALGFALAMPYLTLYLHEELGVRMTLIGMMLMMAGVVGSMAAPIGGSLSDRFGRRNLLKLLLISRALMFVFLGWLVMTHKSFIWFSAFYIVSSLLGTSIFPLMDAMIADVTEKKLRSSAYSILRVAANLGWALGPAIGGFLVVGGYYKLFFFTSGALLISYLIVWFKLPETNKSITRPPAYNPFAILTEDKRLMVFLIVFLVLGFVRGQLIATLSVHASGAVGLSKQQIGWLFAINGGLVTFFQLIVTRITNRYHPLSALTFAALLYGIGYSMIGFAADWNAMAGAMIIITMGEMVEAPTAAAYASSLSPEGKQGGYMGAYNLALHLGWTVGPLLGGILLDTMPNPLYAWELLGSIALIAGIGFVVIRHRTK